MQSPLESSEMPWVSKPGALRYWRERACLTVPELAKRAGVSERTIYAHESDKPHTSQIETFNRLVEALKKFGCTIAALAVHDEEQSRAKPTDEAQREVDDTSTPELGTLSRRAQRERQLGLHRQVLRTPSESYELLGLDRFKKCLSRPRAYDGKRFAVHGVVDEYMGIPPAARRILKCDDGGRFRVTRNVAPDLLLYTTAFAVTAADADRLDDALDGSSISVLVRLVHAPPDGDWKGFVWFEKSPKPREFAFVVERFLADGEVLKELPPKAFSKV
jgi:transcriptional regulator with XRE-family HTH domain